jgi:hypothetical protein
MLKTFPNYSKEQCFSSFRLRLGRAVILRAKMP